MGYGGSVDDRHKMVGDEDMIPDGRRTTAGLYAGNFGYLYS